jgi:hypothetical protein
MKNLKKSFGIHTNVTKNNIQLSPESLFQRFNNMTVTEYAFSDCSVEESNLILNDLYHQGKIEKI